MMLFVSEAEICTKCWKFIKIAVRIIDRALEGKLSIDHPESLVRGFWISPSPLGIQW